MKQDEIHTLIRFVNKGDNGQWSGWVWVADKMNEEFKTSRSPEECQRIYNSCMSK